MKLSQRFILQVLALGGRSDYTEVFLVEGFASEVGGLGFPSAAMACG